MQKESRRFILTCTFPAHRHWRHTSKIITDTPCVSKVPLDCHKYFLRQSRVVTSREVVDGKRIPISES